MAPRRGPDAQTRARLKEIKLEDIDFDTVKECNDKYVLKQYITLIEDDGSYFPDLLKACKNKLLEVAPKEYFLLYPSRASEEEVDEATRDLLEWEAVVKETDKALQHTLKGCVWDCPPKVSAPVRGQDPVAARPNLQSKDPRAREAPKEKCDAYARDKAQMKDYYSAWDKVDVDKMEAEMDREEQELEESRKRHFEDLKNTQKSLQATTEVGQGVVPEQVPQAHWKHIADSEKEKGNEAFYSKDFDEAEAYYSRSIHFRPDDPSTWANRALVRLKLERPSDALADCEHSLALNPQYMKALHRKGKALHDLKRFEEAVHCFQLALVESPGNTQINGDLMVARRHLRSAGSMPEKEPCRVDAMPTCRIEEVPDEADTQQAGPAMGYTRVLIEEDSESEDGGAVEGPPRTPAADASAAGGSQASFHQVVIEEVSDSEEEPPVPAVPATTLAEDHAVASPVAPAALAPASQALVPPRTPTPEFRFDDMD